MSDFRFIHAADLHVGSQLQKLERYPGAPIERMRSAPQQAVERLMDHAIEHQVDALLIAGDLFDGPWADARVSLWFADQLRRLDRENIPVFCIRGNHDAKSLVSRVVEWPKNVHEFGEQPQTATPLACGLVVHGCSFGTPKVTEDLAANYPKAVPDAFNIGLLHTSLEGSALHDPYAPTRVEVLDTKGYDYWALGHIHARTEQSLSDRSWIGYAGNPQGRNIREPGEKGCYLVDVRDRAIASVQFLATDVARWHTLALDLSDLETLDELCLLARERIEKVVSENDRLVHAIRIQLMGATRLHASLGEWGLYDHLTSRLRSIASEVDMAWLEKIDLQTSPRLSTHSLRYSQTILDEARSILNQWRQDCRCDHQFAEAKQLLGNKLAGQLVELGWTSEESGDWSIQWDRITSQAERYLESFFDLQDASP